MAITNIKKTEEVLSILKNYQGSNPYILTLKRDFYINKKDCINEFEENYILLNYKKEPRQINKNVKLADWYAEKKKKEWNLDFLPVKIKIVSYLGETNGVYHCYIQYRQSVPPFQSFLSKDGIINDFLCEDYHNVSVDFDRYDNLSDNSIMANKTGKTHHLLPHQKEGIQFLLSRKKCILADGMGLGKTTTLTTAAIEGNFDSVLIVCPASLKTNWKDELEWYVPERDIAIIESPQGKTKSELEKYLGYPDGKSNKTIKELMVEAKERGKWVDNRFVIINYDILEDFYPDSNLRSPEKIKNTLDNNPLLKYIYGKKSLLIFDESHRLSNNTSNVFKLVKKLISVGNPEGLYLATGTPISNNPENLYNLLLLINDGVSNNWEYYVERYCSAMKIPAKGEKEKWTNRYLSAVEEQNWYCLSNEQKEELKVYIRKHARMITIKKEASNLEELQERVAHIYLRRTKEDIGKMPEKHVYEYFYDLTMEQEMEYQKLWDEYEAKKREENPEKELNKDLLEGGLYRRYLSVQMVPNTIKLCDKIVKRGEKVIIICCYDDELYKLQEYYGDKCVIFNGKMSLKEKDNAREKFINNPDVQVFIGNVISCGVGINLTIARCLVFCDFDYNYSNNSQAEDRIHRIGQTKECHIFYQIFRNTEYERMWNINLRKKTITDKVIVKESEK